MAYSITHKSTVFLTDTVLSRYSAIVRDSDGEEYKVPDYYGDDFEEFVCKKFQFHLLMKNDTYPDDFKNRFDVITVE